MKYLAALLPLGLCWVLVGFLPSTAPVTLTEDMLVSQALKRLGDPTPKHVVNNQVEGISAEAGRQLVLFGIADDPLGGSSGRQSKHFVCTSCHNVKREDPVLTVSDPEARLQYVLDNNLPFLPGTTLYGVVNRETYYNDDYEKKYGDLVRPARKDLRKAIQLCATECAQGRPLADWEMESILSYLWTIGLKIEDLDLTPQEMGMVLNIMNTGKEKAKAIDLLKSKYLSYSPAHFVTPPPDRNAGYAPTGDVERGLKLYEKSCLHCHEERRYSFFNLDETDMTLAFLAKHMPRYTRYSSYQVIRYGTSPTGGKRAYMPHYTQERMSDQQVEDLRAYFESGY
ncbi:MAG: c-type cytochrome [Bacteroidota bacterium]